MVSFSCESCADVLTKKKLDPHRKQCPSAQFTCLDCHVTFKGFDYRSHSNCITEAQKTQGPFYKAKKAKTESRKSTTTASQSRALVPRNALPEEPPETPDTRVAIVDAPPRAPSPPPPPKSLPAPAGVNVFDFLVTDGKDGPSEVNTPKADEFTTDEEEDDEEWEDADDVFMDPPPDYDAEIPYNAQRDFDEHGYSYGTEPIRQSLRRYDSNPDLPTDVMAYLINHDDDDDDDDADADADADDSLKTPAPNHTSATTKPNHERTLSADSTTKKSGKRKRSQPEDLDLSRIRAYAAPSGDVVMTDVPTPSLHSGLTGGLNRMMMARSAAGGYPFPPSPDDSIGDLEGEERAKLARRSPLKRTKHSGSKERGRSREKGRRDKRDREQEHKRVKKSRRESDQSRKLGRWERRRPHGRSESPLKEKETTTTSLLGKALKAIEYHPARDEPKPHNGNAVILHPSTVTSRAEMFMSVVAGSSLVENDERGCSVYKALRRWHREKGNTSKAQEEKELWRDLRLKVNDRGEIVLFC